MSSLPRFLSKALFHFYIPGVCSVCMNKLLPPLGGTYSSSEEQGSCEVKKTFYMIPCLFTAEHGAHVHFVTSVQFESSCSL
jgi:hypothetical protein